MKFNLLNAMAGFGITLFVALIFFLLISALFNLFISIGNLLNLDVGKSIIGGMILFVAIVVGIMVGTWGERK